MVKPGLSLFGFERISLVPSPHDAMYLAVTDSSTGAPRATDGRLGSCFLQEVRQALRHAVLPIAKDGRARLRRTSALGATDGKLHVTLDPGSTYRTFLMQLHRLTFLLRRDGSMWVGDGNPGAPRWFAGI